MLIRKKGIRKAFNKRRYLVKKIWTQVWQLQVEKLWSHPLLLEIVLRWCRCNLRLGIQYKYSQVLTNTSSNLPIHFWKTSPFLHQVLNALQTCYLSHYPSNLSRRFECACNIIRFLPLQHIPFRTISIIPPVTLTQSNCNSVPFTTLNIHNSLFLL